TVRKPKWVSRRGSVIGMPCRRDHSARRGTTLQSSSRFSFGRIFCGEPVTTSPENAPWSSLMPELPEVETVRRGLQPVMEGARFEKVEAHRGDLRWPLPKDFVRRLERKTVAGL